MTRSDQTSRVALQFIVSACCLGVLLVFGLPTTARAESNQAIHERLLAGIGQVNFDPSAPESSRTIDAAWIIEAARKHVDINIYGAAIRGPLLLPYFTFEGEVQLGRCTFDGYVNFGFTVFNRRFAAYQSIFKAGASFEEATFNSRADFGSEFEGGGAWFQDVRARGIFDASGAIFGGKTGSTSFSRAHFDRGAVFSSARFDTDADFSGAEFGEKTDFLGVQFHGNAIFDRAHFSRATSFGDSSNQKLISAFSGNARFNLAQFDSDVWFVGVPFHGDAQFISVRFGGDAFQGTLFQGDARFDRSQIVGSAFFRSEPTVPAIAPAIFEKGAWFDYAHFERDAFFNGVRFDGPASFQEAAFHVVHFSQVRKAPEEETAELKSTLDFRGFTYDRIYAPWRTLLSRAIVYDRQPYTQLEKILRSAGEDDEADQVYLARRIAERREVKWKQSKFSWVFDLVWGWAANYGILSWRLFLFPVVFLVLGVFLFRLPGAAQHIDTKQTRSRITRGDSIRLSLRTFLPLEVPWENLWIPAHQPIRFWKRNWEVCYSDFAVLLKVLGWLFVPLWVAVLAGVFRHLPS